MKLQKSNKYVRKLTAGLTAAIISAGILAGCESVKVEEPIPTEIVEAMPTLTPMPTATPIPELSREEEFELLNISDLETTILLQSINVFEYNTEHGKNIIFTYIQPIETNKNSFNVYELFTSKLLFSLDYNLINQQAYSYDLSHITIKNSNLKEASILKGFNLFHFADSTTILKPGSIKANDYYDIIRNNDGELFDRKLTLEEAADMYLSLVPKKYRVTAEDIGAVDKDKVLVK